MTTLGWDDCTQLHLWSRGRGDAMMSHSDPGSTHLPTILSSHMLEHWPLISIPTATLINKQRQSPAKQCDPLI